jgi:hypothetical protein
VGIIHRVKRFSGFYFFHEIGFDKKERPKATRSANPACKAFSPVSGVSPLLKMMIREKLFRITWKVFSGMHGGTKKSYAALNLLLTILNSMPPPLLNCINTAGK